MHIHGLMHVVCVNCISRSWFIQVVAKQVGHHCYCGKQVDKAIMRSAFARKIIVAKWRMNLNVFATVGFAERAMVLIVEHGYGVGVGHICSCAAAVLLLQVAE